MTALKHFMALCHKLPEGRCESFPLSAIEAAVAPYKAAAVDSVKLFQGFLGMGFGVEIGASVVTVTRLSPTTSDTCRAASSSRRQSGLNSPFWQ